MRAIVRLPRSEQTASVETLDGIFNFIEEN